MHSIVVFPYNSYKSFEILEKLKFVPGFQVRTTSGSRPRSRNRRSEAKIRFAPRPNKNKTFLIEIVSKSISFEQTFVSSYDS